MIDTDLSATDIAWMDDAACRGMDVERFFPLGDGNPKAPDTAVAVCRSCPVRTDCLDTALAYGPDLYGVWGGTTQTQRRALRRSLR